MQNNWPYYRLRVSCLKQWTPTVKRQLHFPTEFSLRSVWVETKHWVLSEQWRMSYWNKYNPFNCGEHRSMMYAERSEHR